MTRASQRALDMIIGFEVSSPAEYQRNGFHPDWPGGLSGPTWGIGYDGGYETSVQILADWQGLLGSFDAHRLAAVAGIHGPSGLAAAASIRDIVIPWSAAHAVFIERNVPRYEAMTIAAFPRSVELSGDAFGALLSLVYNRGAGMNDAPGDSQHRRREMRQIRDCVAASCWEPIPDLIASMERLWSNGLRGRREMEARLFADGIGLAWHGAGKATNAYRPVVTAEAVTLSPPPEQTADDLNAAELRRIT